MDITQVTQKRGVCDEDGVREKLSSLTHTLLATRSLSILLPRTYITHTHSLTHTHTSCTLVPAHRGGKPIADPPGCIDGPPHSFANSPFERRFPNLGYFD